MRKVPYDLQGAGQRQFADKVGLGESTVAGWKKAGEMPYWVTLIPSAEDPRIDDLKAENARLNMVIDELIKRLAR
jgi:transposase